jgi:hypothetical protein
MSSPDPSQPEEEYGNEQLEDEIEKLEEMELDTI